MSTALSKTLHALSDPTRREILRLLRAQNMTAGQIAEQFAMSAPSVSHHLSALKQAELVLAVRAGQTIIYSLNATVVQEFLQSMLDMFSGDTDASQATEPPTRRTPRTKLARRKVE